MLCFIGLFIISLQGELARGRVSCTEARVATLIGVVLTVITGLILALLMARIPSVHAVIPATTTIDTDDEPPLLGGPLRVLFQPYFQNFVLSLSCVLDQFVAAQPAGLQKWLDRLTLHLPHFRVQGRVSSLVMTTKTAILTEKGVDEKRGEFRKYAIVNGTAFFETGGDHIAIMPAAAELTIFPDNSKLGTGAPAMCVPLPQMSIVEERDGMAGRIDAAEFLMKHPEVRDYVQQVYTTDGAAAVNPGMTYLVDEKSVTLAYQQALSDTDKWTDVPDEGLTPTGLTSSESSSAVESSASKISGASDLEIRVGSTIEGGALISSTTASPGGYLLPLTGILPVGPHIATNFDLRPQHHDLLSIIPVHLAPTAIYCLRYAASLPIVDGGKFALALYVLFVDLADFYIPTIGQMPTIVIPLEILVEARERIAKIYLATCTYLFMLYGKDVGYELGLQYDALVHARGLTAVFNTHRIALAQEYQTQFKRAPIDGNGNPLLLPRERFWFLAMADLVIQKHAESLKKDLDDHHDALFSAMCRFANNRPAMFPIVPAVGPEMI